jgi:uncharacterized membrane protein YdjX (TVP38/TMEM64 family)
MRPETLKALVDRAGVWGPLVIIGLMIVSVVASPIPSAPIAMAAGAAYGHLWGTVQIVLGAELGALIAFCIARALGRDAVRRMFGERADAGLLGSQNALMGAVFASRLMPFVSFDMISYAAGLSCLRPWRFAVATFAGIVPASFALVYLGAQIAGADMRLALWAALGLGLITGAPALWIALRRKAKKKT